MKLKQNLLSWLTLGAGLLGAGLCAFAASAGTDDRGLLPAGHPAFIAVCVLIPIVIGFLFFMLRDVRGELPYGKLFPVDALSLAGHFTAIVGIAATSVITLVDNKTTFGILAAVSGFLAALSMGFIGFFRLKHLRPHYFFHGIVTIHILLFLILRYQSWNTLPQLQLYLTQMLAALFLMITFYQRTTLDAGSGKRRDYMFFNYGALFLCCLAAVSDDWLFYAGLGIWCFTNQCSLQRAKRLPPMSLPEEVSYCLQTLEYGGHSAYVVGGCVRDHLMGLAPSDYDMCTSATPQEICELFERHELVRNGEKHGTIGVVVASQLYEITTFRTESTYSDGRHPDEVAFVSDIREDLARRDFTVNAMAYSPEAGFIDPFGGQQDLTKKVLRAVGDPQVRFQEDALRILRGVRFAVRFGFTPEEKTLAGMIQCAPLMRHLAQERISAELAKLLPLVSTQQFLQYKPIFVQLFPALAAEEGAYEKVAAVMDALPQELPLRLAALLHRLDKAEANETLLQLKLSNVLRDRTATLLTLLPTELPADKKQLRHLMGEYGADTIEQLLALQIAIAAVNEEDTLSLESVRLLLKSVRQDGSCLNVKDLAITGSDLLSLGVQPGPHMGRCMQALLSLVQEEVLSNEKDELLDAAKKYFEVEENI